jgi:U3 small nucleolar RNA-associated protein 10
MLIMLAQQVLVRFFYVFQRTIRQADRARLPALVRTTFKFFLEALDICHDPQFPTISEDHMLPAFLDLVEKLNEATFKPLFSRLYDWAVISPEESAEGKHSVAISRSQWLMRSSFL